jgi:hypothetical protein
MEAGMATARVAATRRRAAVRLAVAWAWAVLSALGAEAAAQYEDALRAARDEHRARRGAAAPATGGAVAHGLHAGSKRERDAEEAEEEALDGAAKRPRVVPGAGFAPWGTWAGDYAVRVVCAALGVGSATP